MWLVGAGVAPTWKEEVRDSLVPPRSDRAAIGEGSRLPSPQGLGSLLGIRSRKCCVGIVCHWILFV